MSDMGKTVRAVDPARVIKQLAQGDQFVPYTEAGLTMQWGGLSDPFDENERQFGISLQLMKWFREREFPIRYCTKGTWWTEDERYLELMRGAGAFWNVMYSIITLDEEKARRVEVLAPSPKERLLAIGRLAKIGIPVTLRLRPFIIGVSTPTYLDLIRQAHDAGATAVSTEFLCLEGRASTNAQMRFAAISRVAGYDILKMYKAHSATCGYYRLNREIKKPYIEAMRDQAHKLGMRFAVSDAHFKELCDTGSCCALPDGFTYHKGQWTEALQIAKKNGAVSWSDIEPSIVGMDFLWQRAGGFNTNSTKRRAQYYYATMKQWLRMKWNDTKGSNGLYRYFGGILAPDHKDVNGDMVYRYTGDR
jgi:DNA repair photolyase